MYEIKIGQIWQDLDRRSNGRQFRIERLDKNKLYAYTTGQRAQTRKILIRRLYKSGHYRLIQEVKVTQGAGFAQAAFH